MTSKNIYDDFCELIAEHDKYICQLCDALNGPVDLEDILGYSPDWDDLELKVDNFKERLKLLMENWAKLKKYETWGQIEEENGKI